MTNMSSPVWPVHKHDVNMASWGVTGTHQHHHVSCRLDYNEPPPKKKPAHMAHISYKPHSVFCSDSCSGLQTEKKEKTCRHWKTILDRYWLQKVERVTAGDSWSRAQVQFCVTPPSRLRRPPLSLKGGEWTPGPEGNPTAPQQEKNRWGLLGKLY